MFALPLDLVDDQGEIAIHIGIGIGLHGHFPAHVIAHEGIEHEKRGVVQLGHIQD